MGFSQYIELLPSSGYGSQGFGAPMFVGRNRDLTLLLDVTDAAADLAVSVTLESAASGMATRWRGLGPAVTWTGLGNVAVTGALSDAWVRGRFGLVVPSGSAIGGLSLSGMAQLVLAPPASRSGTGSVARIDMAQYHGGRFAVLVTEAPAGETLTVTLERSGDGGVWEPVGTFPLLSGLGETTLESADLDRFVRITWACSGPGAWTFGVAGTAHLIYARTRDRARLGIRQAAIPNTTPAQYLDALLTATQTVQSYYTRYDHPLRAWGRDTSKAAIALADWELLSSRGEEPARSPYAIEADRWTTWLRQVAGVDAPGRKLVPADIVDSAPANERGEVKHWSFESDPSPLASPAYGGFGWPFGKVIP